PVGDRPHRRHDGRLRALDPAPRVRARARGGRARDALRADGGAARAAVHHRRATGVRAEPAQHLPRGVAADGRERVQHHRRQTLLRLAAARGVRGGAHGWGGAGADVRLARAAHVEADRGCRLGVHHHRLAQGLPVAEARAARPRGATARGAAAEHPVADRARCDARGPRDLDDHPCRVVPALPAGVPARCGARRRREGLTRPREYALWAAGRLVSAPKCVLSRTSLGCMRGRMGVAVGLVTAPALLVGCTAAATPVSAAPPHPWAPATEPAPVDADAAYVEARLADMSTLERAASVLMIRVPSPDPQTARAAVAASGVGGVILMGGDTQYSVAASAALTSALTVDPPLPPLTAVDQEGGIVARLPDPGPSARQLASEPADAARAAFAARAELVASAGIDINFGIVADVTP